MDRNGAVYRAMNPKSHEWDVNTELLSAIFYVLQWANWQRGGGKGERPELVTRPNDNEKIVVGDVSIADRKAANEDEIARRRARRGAEQRTRMVEVTDGI